MKKFTVLMMSVVATCSLSAAPLLALTSDDVIRANCRSAQSILNQLEKVDAALRINRGRVYSEVSDLFYAMNSRLASNKISALHLAEITSTFDEQTTNFRNKYNEYDDKLNDLIQMDCQKEPKKFHEALIEFREKRAGLRDSVMSLDKLIDDYKNEFSKIAKEHIDVK